MQGNLLITLLTKPIKSAKLVILLSLVMPIIMVDFFFFVLIINIKFSLIDVDHCLDSDVCDQICGSFDGSPACECQDGYELTAGTGQCKATGERII